jgi:hypothetical protein
VVHHRKAPGDVEDWLRNHLTSDVVSAAAEPRDVLRFALRGLDRSGHSVLAALAAMEGPAPYQLLSQSLIGGDGPLRSDAELDAVLGELEDRGLIAWDRRSNSYDIHPVVRAAVLHPSG